MTATFQAERRSLIILCAILALSAAHAETLTGRATVVDADTLDIHGERIRILDIDAPEDGQTCIDQAAAEYRCGQQAAIALPNWMGNRVVARETEKLDRYKRHLLDESRRRMATV